MNINLKVRIKNKTFWVQMIPAIILLIEYVAEIFGLHIDLGDLGNKILNVVNTVFMILALVGVVNDPTTSGMSDSERAMSYEEPYKD